MTAPSLLRPSPGGAGLRRALVAELGRLASEARFLASRTCLVRRSPMLARRIVALSLNMATVDASFRYMLQVHGCAGAHDDALEALDQLVDPQDGGVAVTLWLVALAEAIHDPAAFAASHPGNVLSTCTAAAVTADLIAIYRIVCNVYDRVEQGAEPGAG